MIVKENNIETVKLRLQYSVSTKQGYFCYHVFNKPFCIVNSYDRPIKPLNIDIWDLRFKGGTFIINTGDVGILLSAPIVPNNKAKQLLDILVDKFIELLYSKKLNVHKDKNDILIDDYKICGYTFMEVGNNFVGAMSFNFNIDLNLIKEACNKPMVKIPKSLSDYGITQKEIIELISSLEEVEKEFE